MTTKCLALNNNFKTQLQQDISKWPSKRKNGTDDSHVISGPRYETRVAIHSYWAEDWDNLDEMECEEMQVSTQIEDLRREEDEEGSYSNKPLADEA